MKKGKARLSLSIVYFIGAYSERKKGRMCSYYVCIDSERCTNFIDLRIQAETGCVNPDNVFGVVNHNGLTGQPFSRMPNNRFLIRNLNHLKNIL